MTLYGERSIKESGLHPRDINRVLKGERKTYSGYTFRKIPIEGRKAA